MSPTEPRFPPLDRDRLPQRIARLLADAVATGRLRPGERLSEAATARELGVSRAPVREAARLLESSGLLTADPGRGFFVRRIDAEALDALYEFRIAVEAEAAARLTRLKGREAEPQLRESLERLRSLGARDRVDEQIAADMDFHRLIAALAGNPRLMSAFDEIALEMRIGVGLIGRLHDDPERIAESHAPIVEAIASGDEAAARAAIRNHLASAREAVVAALRDIERKAEP